MIPNQRNIESFMVDSHATGALTVVLDGDPTFTALTNVTAAAAGLAGNPIRVLRGAYTASN